MSPVRLKVLAEFAHSLGLEVLMEAHNQKEIEAYLNPFLDVIGVNNRNLKTMEVSVQTSFDLFDFMPKEFAKISESGLSDPKDILKLHERGYDGFLVGESFMKTENPPQALGDLISELKK